MFGDFAALDKRIDLDLKAKNAAELYEIVLERLERDYDADKKNIIKCFMSYIWYVCMVRVRVRVLVRARACACAGARAFVCVCVCVHVRGLVLVLGRVRVHVCVRVRLRVRVQALF